MTALGFIETKGLLAAIEGADAMLKAAEVRLLEKTLASGGLVTISVAGDVAAVQASVDAGVAAIRQVNAEALVSDHVIPRPDTGLENIILTKVLPEDDAEEGAADMTESFGTGQVVAEAPEVTVDIADEPALDHVAAEVPEETPVDELTEETQTESEASEEESAEDVAVKEADTFAPEPEAVAPVQKETKPEPPRHELSQLKKMNVSKLRGIARKFEGFSIPRKEIKFARKKELIEALMNAYRQEEE